MMRSLTYFAVTAAALGWVLLPSGKLMANSNSFVLASAQDVQEGQSTTEDTSAGDVTNDDAEAGDKPDDPVQGSAHDWWNK